MVGALVFEQDPFATALRRCANEGEPLELGARWRRGVVRTDDPELRSTAVLHDLASALVECLSAPEATAASAAVVPPREDLRSIQVVAGVREIVAEPFRQFRQLGAFLAALRSVYGVSDLVLRRVVDGTVQVRLRYDDPVPLAARIAQLDGFGPIAVGGTDLRVVVRLAGPSGLVHRSSSQQD